MSDRRTASLEGTAQADAEISILDLLIVLVERKRTIFLVTAASTVVALIVALLLPVRYTATVVVLPPQQSNSLSAALTSQFGSLGGVAALAGSGLGLKNPNDMYVAMFKSRTVEDAMIQRFGLVQEYHTRYLSDTRKAFENHSTVDGSGKDGLIQISVEDHDPRRAAKMANAYVEEYRKLSEHLAIGEAGQRRLFFERQLQQAKDNLAQAEEALKATEQKTGMIQLDAQARALIESAATLRAQVAAKEVQIQGMETYATDENSQLIQAQQELDSLRTQLARLGGSEDNSDSLIVPKGLVPQASIEYARRLRDVKYYETIFNILAREYELAKLDEAREGAIIQVVDPAIVPDKKSFPQRTLIVIVAMFAGFICGSIIALVGAGLKRLEGDREVRDKLNLLRRFCWMK